MKAIIKGFLLVIGAFSSTLGAILVTVPFALVVAAACAAPESTPTPRPTYTLAATPTPRPTYTLAATPTPRPTYTPYPATTTPQPTYTPYPASAAASGDVTIFEVEGITEWLSGAALAAYDKGQEQFANGEYEAAIASFKEAQRHHSKPSDILESWIGFAYGALGQYDTAIVHHSNAIAINDDAVNRVNRAVSYFDNSQCEPAINDARAALTKKMETGEGRSTHVDANYLLAFCLYEQSKYRQALQHADAAIAIANDHQYDESEVVQMTELRNEIRYELNR